NTFTITVLPVNDAPTFTILGGTNGSVAWWKAEGNANDSVGGHNGTVQNGAGFVAGISGRSFSFDGTSQYVSTADSPSWDLGTADFTIQGWINTPTPGATMRLIAAGSWVDGANNLWTFGYGASSPIWGNGNHLNFAYWNGSGYVDISSDQVAIPPNTWHHIAVVRSGATLTFYFDGAAAGSSSIGSVALNGGSTGVILGARYQSSPSDIIEFANGSIDEVQLFNRALSALEIQSNYAALGTGTPTVVVTEDSGAYAQTNFAMNISAGPADETAQTVVFTLTSDHPELFSVQPAIALDGTLTFTPARNANGSALVQAVLRDNAGTANGGVDSTTNWFTITIAPVNDAPSFALPGWSTWSPRESSRGWCAIASSADGSKLVALDSGGLIYTSTDFGVTWTPQAGAGARAWNAVASSADGTKLVATANNGQIYTSTDSGTNWVAHETNREWRCVASSADGSTLVAGVENGQLYTSTDSGQTWTARESGRIWLGVACSADGTKMVAVAPYDRIYTSTDSGQTWTSHNGQKAWRTVASSVDGTKLVAAEQGGQIYTSTDSGLTWTARASNRGWYFLASSADGTKLSAVADNDKIYVSADSGVTWTARESSRGWRGITSSADGSRLAAVSPNELIFTATDALTVTVLEDSGPYTQAGLATGISAGPADESAQVVSFVVNNNNNALFSIQPTMDASGTLTFTPAVHANGTATVTVIAQDDGGTANGGVDKATNTFTINITPVNDAPSIKFAANNLVVAAGASQSVPSFATFSVGPANESGQNITNVVVANNNAALFSVAPALALDGTLTFTTAAGAAGMATVTVIAQDNGGTANGGVDSVTNSFTVSLSSINQAPSFTFTTSPDQDGVQAAVRSASTNLGSGVKVVVDGSGNAIVAGDEQDSRFVYGMTVVKYAADGTVVWTNHFYDATGQFNQAAQVKGLAVDGAGNVFVTGQSEISFGEVADLQWVTIKYSGTDGSALWTNYFHDVSDDIPAGMVVDAAGNAIVTGSYWNPAGQGTDYLTIKYAGDGTPLWTNVTSGTGTGSDTPASLALDSAFNVLVTGTAFNGTNKEIFTVKYAAATGLPLWTNTFDGNSSGDDGGLTVAVDSADNVLVLGSVLQDGYAQFITLKYAANGTPVWTNLYYRTGSGDHPVSLAVDGSDNVIVVGETWNGPDADFTTIKYLPSGVAAWTNHLDVAVLSADIPHAVAVNAAGDVFITGESLLSNSKDYLTIKYSSSGTPVWTNTFNGNLNGNDVANAIAVDTNGNAWVTGVGDNVITTVKYAFIPGTANQTNYATAGRVTVSNLVSSTSGGPGSEARVQTVTNFIVVNDYGALFATQPAIDVNGTLTYQLSGLPGVATVTVISEDNGGTLFGGQNRSAARTFTITVNQVIQDRNAVAYVWNGGTGDWSDPAKWTPVGVPDQIDSAQIDSGTVNVTNPVVLADLILTGGSLAGSGVISVTTSLVWTGGSMDGAGRTTIPRNALLTLSGAAEKNLNRQLDNYGTVTWSGARITGDGAPVINNYAGALFDIQTDATLYESYRGGTRTFNNRGTLRKSSTTGATTILGTFSNDSLLEIRSGIVSLADGYAPTTSSSLRVILGGVAAGTQFGQLQVGGVTALSGSLDIVLTNNFVPNSGDAFLIVNATAFGGTFASVTGGTLAGGLVLTPGYAATTGITLTAGVGTGPARFVAPAISPVAVDGLRMLRLPAGAAGYELQTTTGLGPNAVWTPVRAPVMVEQGMQVIHLPDTGSVRFYRLIPAGSTRNASPPVK
ncbi:MAG: hypothetical protein EBS84_20975, partial [Proteobacteria bacterium]|nr:hypothetical protein [Pseudomonadota bacterium]